MRLEELTNEAHKYKVKVIVDVVCNHTANKGEGIDSLTPSDEVAADLLENNSLLSSNIELMLASFIISTVLLFLSKCNGYICKFTS